MPLEIAHELTVNARRFMQHNHDSARSADHELAHRSPQCRAS
jgi:hypothetical protein